MEYAGSIINFRAPIALATLTSVEPDEDALRLLFEGPQPMAVAFVPDDSLNGFYAVASFELGYKLTLYYDEMFGAVPEISSLPVSGREEALAASSNRTVIFLVGNADSTKVSVNGTLIEVRGSDMTENGRDYTDLDLAVDKLLLTVME